MTTAESAERSGVPRGGVLARYPLVFFFFLSFVFTFGYLWLIVVPLNLPDPLKALATAGPPISAFLILALTSGKPGVLRLLRSYVHWRVGVRWYLVTLIGVQALMFLAYVVVPGALADFVAPDWSFFVPFYLGEAAFTLFLAGGPLLEEGGWRGFALPRLQHLHGPLVGTIILGTLWSLWHGWIFVGPLAVTGPDPTFVSVGTAFVLFTIGLIGLSVIMTWVLNNTGGSVLMAILLHWAFDMGPAFVVFFPSTTPYYVPVSYQGMGIAIVFSVAALVVIVATRGHLGYQRYQREVELPATAETAR